jgi:hypothetical protein
MAAPTLVGQMGGMATHVDRGLITLKDRFYFRTFKP